MQTAWAVASLTPAAACTGCYLGHRRRTEAGTAAAMVLMLLGMADAMVLGGRVLTPVAWGAVLAAGAVGLLVHGVRRGSVVDPVLHLAAMAALLVLPALTTPRMHHHGQGVDGWALLAVLAVALAHTGRAWLQILRAPDTAARVEVGAAAASVLAMTAMAVS